MFPMQVHAECDNQCDVACLERYKDTLYDTTKLHPYDHHQLLHSVLAGRLDAYDVRHDRRYHFRLLGSALRRGGG